MLGHAKSSDSNDDWVYVPNSNWMLERVSKKMVEEQMQLFFSADDSVQLELYTLQNPHKPDILLPDNIESIKNSHMNKNRPTRIYIHGWQEWGGLMKGIFNRGK